ncbi:uncharacterized protein LOC127278152 isoform X1 [Leptopilina boulardi]|uniref:uncharacterized protein LOC127278152 isoform X1 n=1 Tax=Leptopilina boulardi TaxID=63433 RepID=UPI0021F66418|nr:uncharacterized protein LOC127278152 isoform X1 [Leptopilina boulardi]
MPKIVNTESAFMKSCEIAKTLKRTNKITRCTYSRENLLLAVEEVKKGMSVAGMARKYNVPESTIRSKRDNKYADKKPGPATVLTTQEEDEIANWIFLCCQRGFPVTKNQLLESVEVICQKIKREIPFSNGKPGRSWFEGFLKRHPQISKSFFDNSSINKANVTEESLEEWFEQISRNLSSINLLSIEPNRIFNCDEIGLPLNPETPPKFSSKGSKIDHNTVNNNQKKENISILIAGNAAGELASTFILFPEESLSKKAAPLIPTEFPFGYSENGSMTSKNFYEFIVNAFDPWLTRNRVKRPVLLYIDGHKFQLTFDISKFCTENEIELISLHPDATNILTPLCKSFFHDFETRWKEVKTNVTYDFTKTKQFISVLKQTLDTLNAKEVLPTSFMEYGLYPLKVDSTNFTEDSNCNENAIEYTNDNNNWERLQILESLISEDKLYTFRQNESPEWKGEIKDESLFEIWYKLSSSCIERIHDTSNIEMNDPLSYPEEVDNFEKMDFQFIKVENDDELNEVYA